MELTSCDFALQASFVVPGIDWLSVSGWLIMKRAVFFSSTSFVPGLGVLFGIGCSVHDCFVVLNVFSTSHF